MIYQLGKKLSGQKSILVKAAAAVALLVLMGADQTVYGKTTEKKPLNVSGVYPHLAMYNNHGECGTGAVVPWANRLWVITYSPHMPNGSSDRLHEITPDLELIIRKESVGGTPANRMIHGESGQLNIGAYFIDEKGMVRVISPKVMPGRLTGTARHLTDPENKLYIATMEEGLYEVDVNTLDVNWLVEDGNGRKKSKLFSKIGRSKLPGYHGKGLYSGQGQLLYSNNGEHGGKALRDPTTVSGALAKWDGKKKDWSLILREQFTEITGPSGIKPSADNVNDPIWAMGWDHGSVILRLLEDEKWSTYRLPKSSFSYDGAHGWNTEWPRIREIGTGNELLATMHGTFWNFPKTFSRENSAGIKPRSSYLKVVGDFARWGDYVVLGCDDSAQKEFLNTRTIKNAEAAPLASNSNLWFVKPERLNNLGPALGSGSAWLNEKVKRHQVSDSYLFSGYDRRMLHLSHSSKKAVTFTLEIDVKGNNEWRRLTKLTVPAKGYVAHIFKESDRGQWIRIKAGSSAGNVTACFSYASDDSRTARAAEIFEGLATKRTEKVLGGTMRGLDYKNRTLGFVSENNFNEEHRFYEIDAAMNFLDKPKSKFYKKVIEAKSPDINKIPVTVDGNSVLVVQDKMRWRLPIAQIKSMSGLSSARIAREVATERDLLNIAGTFFELPARNAGGFKHLRPIASHGFEIHDYSSYRGLLVMTGIDVNAKGSRIYKNKAGSAGVWAGVIDDLWEMGKPVGVGGPWSKSAVVSGKPSDAYLMYGYQDKRVEITTGKNCVVKIQVDPTGNGEWHTYKSINCKKNVVQNLVFPDGFNAHWVRLVASEDTKATATFYYNITN